MSEEKAPIPTKTKGDLRREELARRLGEEWEFSMNYAYGLIVPKQKQAINAIKTDKRDGRIEDFRADLPAFDEDGKPLSMFLIRSIYVKPKPQQP